jgi:tRNA nucleotidyltransferase/poly(A) polymerase
VTGALAAVREALGDLPAWVVGGAVRDELLGRETEDLDVVVDGDVEVAARALGRRARGPAFELSEEFGAWRVIGPGRRWHVDLSRVQGSSIEDDLTRRDLTINAIAQPLQGGPLLDPLGGAADLRAGVLRMAGPRAFTDDPLRTLRLVRFATELGMDPEPATRAAAREGAADIATTSPERVFAELRRIIVADRAIEGLELLADVGLTEHVLPELARLRGVEQNRYHHLDVLDHTIAVLSETIRLERDPGGVLGDESLDGPLRAFLAQPLADDLTRAGALRFGALLHDAAKPETQVRDESGEVLGFPAHAELGAGVSRAALERLRASERLRAHVAALARHHLRLGFLVHEAPLDRRAMHRYLVATHPVEVDVSLLSVADRLATRGRKAEVAIARHLEVARAVLPEALTYADARRLPPLVRGDQLAAALDLEPGPEIGRLLAVVAEARYAGEVATPEDALELARREMTRETRSATADTEP